MSFGAPHRHYAVTDSTNTRARELAEAGAPGGTVVTASEQTAGRGRQGRTWTAPPGKALLYSAILRPLGAGPLLPLIAGLAVCEAAEELAPGVGCQIKWPNDILVDGRKLAGILIETKVQEDWAVLGVGLNLTVEPHEFPPELRNPATSLFDSTPLAAAAALSRHLGWWLDTDRDSILDSYRERDALRGREISWSAGPDLDVVSGSGVAAGIDDRGGLVVSLAGGGRTVLFAGEIHLRL